MKAIIFAGVLTILAVGACAAPGYMYDTGSFTPRLRDRCAETKMWPGLVSWINGRAGLAQRMTAIVSLESPVGVARDGGASSPNDLICHGTFVFQDGSQVAGTVQVTNGEGSEISYVAWVSDDTRRRQAEESAAAARAHQAVLDNCPAAILSRYEIALSPLDNEAIRDAQQSHEYETAQLFAARNDLSRLITNLRQREFDECLTAEKHQSKPAPPGSSSRRNSSSR